MKKEHAGSSSTYGRCVQPLTPGVVSPQVGCNQAGYLNRGWETGPVLRGHSQGLLQLGRVSSGSPGHTCLQGTPTLTGGTEAVGGEVPG